MKKKSYHFHKNITNIINSNDLLHDTTGVIVAVSGGSDSVALLNVLRNIQIDLRLIAVYVDHGLRPSETPDEIANIKKFCCRLDIELIIKTVDVKQCSIDQKISTEEAARHLRYKALEEVKDLHNFDKIAVGHHADDQVEEFFIRLFRGSGVTGLSGMKVMQGHIIRPLLGQTKQAIEQYLKDENIPWSTDSSNLTRDFLRNRIRLDLLPEIETNYNPGIRDTVLNTMDVLQEEDDFIVRASAQAYDQVVEEQSNTRQGKKYTSIYLDTGQYLSHHLAVRRRILEKICWKMKSRPSFIIIADIDRLAQDGENGKELHLREGLHVIKKQNVIHFSHPPLRADKRGQREPPIPYIIVDKTGTYKLPGTTLTIRISEEAVETASTTKKTELRIDREKVEFPLIIRERHPGEKFTPCNSPGSKKISRYFNEQQLDKHRRSSWPILFHRDSVVAVIGYTIDHQYRVTDTTKRVLYISYTEKDSSDIPR
ncbi:MAG: tRNA(Ile)-lysidine synthase [Desulforhopalus sp.]